MQLSSIFLEMGMELVESRGGFRFAAPERIWPLLWISCFVLEQFVCNLIAEMEIQGVCETMSVCLCVSVSVHVCAHISV